MKNVVFLQKKLIMRILTQKEKDLIVKMYEYSSKAQNPLDAYKILDNNITSDATKNTPKEIENTKKIWCLSHGLNGGNLYSLLRLLEINGFIRTLSRYANENLEKLLIVNQKMDTTVCKQGMDWEIFIFLYDTKIEFLEPFMDLAKAKGATLEEELINNSKSVLDEAGKQTKISKTAIWVTVICSIASIILSIISLCKCC